MRQFDLTLDHYKVIPKVELHRHLEGSLRLSTLQEVARTYHLDLPETGRLRPLVQVSQEGPYSASNFLSKFFTLRKFFRSPEIIQRLAFEAIADAAMDNVRYIELRFTPAALSKVEGFPLGDVMDWVIAGVNQAKSELDIAVSLIVSVNRHESVDLAEQVVDLATARLPLGITGIDLAGDEARCPAKPFAGVIQEARQGGLHITIHAGEWAGAANVNEAIELLGAERIGHGIRVLENPSTVALARERGTVFEVCMTSNFQSGVVSTLKSHPLPRLLITGLKTTLNTDDPSICQIMLSHEYQLVCEVLGMPRNVLFGLIQTGAHAAFLPESQRTILEQTLEKELASLSD